MNKTIARCKDCPCFFIDVDVRGEQNSLRCTQLTDDLYNDDGISELCPLRTQPLTLALHEELAHPAEKQVDAEKLAHASICVLRDRFRATLERLFVERDRNLVRDLGFDPFVVPLVCNDLPTLVGDSIVEEAKAMLRYDEAK